MAEQSDWAPALGPIRALCRYPKYVPYSASALEPIPAESWQQCRHVARSNLRSLAILGGLHCENHDLFNGIIHSKHDSLTRMSVEKCLT